MVLLVAVFASKAASQITGFGQCPQVYPVQNFDVVNYSGRWYEIRAYRNLFEILSSCVTADYGLNSDGSVSVVNSLKRFGQRRSITGSATIPQADQGALIVNFPGLPSEFKMKPSKIQF